MATQPDSDRRRAPRVPTDIPTRVHGNEQISCRVVNLSTVGACTICSHEMPEMAELRIHVQVPVEGDEPLSVWCSAAVVRSDRRPEGTWDVGLYFVGMSPEDKEILGRIIDLHSMTSPAS